MPQMDRDLVQPGWEVWTSEGEKLGRVIRVEADSLHVKKEGAFGGELTVPKDAIREVEEGRIEVSISKEQASPSG